MMRLAACVRRWDPIVEVVEMVVAQREPAELAWVFRPDHTRPAEIQALAGAPIYSAGSADVNGAVEVVLRDGTRVRARPAEIVAEGARAAQAGRAINR